ncbi:MULTISPECIES: extracellular solute-binding protein [Streptomyces]|uniref:extracellular solute-binding protein n=1 Tax=Streptomyces TaxID=1883 RepID=UPI0022494B2A|nr:extracellular solute-binding protein [Streptomyces sp. JHD 1]MCX2970886.1 extracellular solute-binding protein [Streptomyces sp. JHD 1]
MNKRILRALAVAACGALTLTACGSGGSSDGSVTLKLVAADYGDQASNSSSRYWEGVATAFEKAHPGITVDVRVINWNEIDSQVKTMIQSGNVPDVLQTGGFADKVADDLLYPAEEVLSPGTRDNLVDSFARAGEVDGVQYGIPFVSSSRVLFYNKDHFAQAGISEPPTTWDELRETAETLAGKVPGVTPYALPLGPEEAQGESLIWELGNGGGYTDADGDYTLDSRPNVETFRWLRDNLVEPGLTYANPATTDRKTAFADFAAGRTAMLNGHPSLLGMAEEGGVDHGVARIPGRSGPLDATLGVADWMMAFRQNGHQEEIRKFLDFAYSKEHTTEFMETYDLMPVTEDTLEELKSGADEDMALFYEVLPDARFYPLGNTTWDAVSARIKRSGGTAVSEDPKKVLGDLQQQAEQIVADQ